jgi:hypothetical protein
MSWVRGESILGISGTKRINQIANFALVDWSRTLPSATLPSAYWPAQMEAKGLRGEAARCAYWHAPPIMARPRVRELSL